MGHATFGYDKAVQGHREHTATGGVKQFSLCSRCAGLRRRAREVSCVVCWKLHVNKHCLDHIVAA
jgi:hypothetical protein